MRKHEKRTREALEWRRYYDTAAWKARRKQQLGAVPYCERCRQEGRGYMPATVCHHITPHKGDWFAFIGGPLRSLCAPCHDRTEQGIEARGYDKRVGVNGWPIDPNHPANSRK